jgi:hypothetical protein
MAGIGPARLGNGKTLMLLHPERFFSRGAPSNAMNRIRDFLRAGFARSNGRDGDNYIVVRHSPDWLSFDPEASRAFCAKSKLPEALIVDFVSVWDAAVAVDYRKFRSTIKEIAQQTLVSVEHARIISDGALRALSLAGKVPTDALVVFVDDDDWLAPHLFERLREFASVEADVDGFRWGSVLLGRDYKWTLDADANFALHPTVTLRPIDQSTIYTNNYAVSGATLRRLGIDAVCEDFDAHAEVDAGRFAPANIAQYLSCSNKHPASTLSAHFLVGSEEFRRDLRADIRRWAEGVTSVPLPVDLAWMAGPRERLAALMADAVDWR